MTEPWPKTEEELTERVRAILAKQTIKSMAEYDKATETERREGYNYTVRALVDVALEAFNYASEVLGPSDFQAQIAALELYGKILRINGPYAVVRAEDMVYPQYDIPAKVRGWMDGWRGWAAGEAAKKLAEAETKDWPVSPDVIRHWKRLAQEVNRQ